MVEKKRNVIYGRPLGHTANSGYHTARFGLWLNFEKMQIADACRILSCVINHNIFRHSQNMFKYCWISLSACDFCQPNCKVVLEETDNAIGGTTIRVYASLGAKKNGSSFAFTTEIGCFVIVRNCLCCIMYNIMVDVIKKTTF